MTKDLFISTVSGRDVPLLNPQPSDIYIEDIAHSLARIARFNGHTLGRVPYSVAQHSVRVMREVRDRIDGTPLDTPGVLLAALLHDAHEAYIGDIASPVKWAVAAFGEDLGLRTLKSLMDSAIAGAFGFEHRQFDNPVIKWADLVLLGAERRDLMPKGAPWSCLEEVGFSHVPTIRPWSVDVAQRKFLAAFKELTKEDRAARHHGR